ncbi:MAG: hypothetical protein R3E01_21490 [Pirellulaceae bacterium]
MSRRSSAKKPKAKKAALAVGPKPQTDIYHVMLFMSLAAVSLACLMLYLELNSYGSFPWWNAPR